MSYTKDEVYALIDDLFGSYMFQRFSDSRKQQEIDELSTHPLLLKNNITRDDVLRIYEYQSTHATEALKQLGRDPLFLILTRSKPRDVISLCQTTPSFARLCHDETIYPRLLKLQYPGATPNPRFTPKQQYIRMAKAYTPWIVGDNTYGQLGIGVIKYSWRREVETFISRISELENFNHITQISCGSYHTAMVDATGKIWTFGRNNVGQLGHRDRQDRFEPAVIVEDQNGHLFNNIVQVACGDNHTAMLDATGQIWTFGRGLAGKLGHGDEQDQLVPVAIKDQFGNNFNNIVQVACGDGHTAMIDNTGQIWTFGKGSWGRLGHGDQQDQLVPMAIKDQSGNNFNNIVQLSCGYYHTAMIDDLGQIWTFGSNNYGQLGHGDLQKRLVPIAIKGFGNDEVKGDIAGVKRDIVQVSCGAEHTAMIDADGQIYTFGDNTNGQTGQGHTGNISTPTIVKSENGDIFDNIVQVSCGSYHTIMLDAAGQAWSFGKGKHAYFSTWDNPRLPKLLVFPTLIEDMEKINRVSCGFNHSAFLV